MKKNILVFILLSCLGKPVFAQYVYTINADSVKITNHCDTAELIIENHTQNIPGFLFNKGRGRTEFRSALVKLNDSVYLIGADTLKIKPVTANNGLTMSGSAIQLGGDLIKHTVLNQNRDSLVLVTSNGTTFFQKDSSTQSIILPGNTLGGQTPMVKRSKRNGFVMEENAAAVDAANSGGGLIVYSKEITNETLPAGVSAPFSGATNSFFSERIQAAKTGTVMLWNIAGPTSLRGRTWNQWMVLVNMNNPFVGNAQTPILVHSIPFYVTPGKGAWPLFAGNAMAVGSTFAVDADSIPLFMLNLPRVSPDTTSNKPLVLNPSTGAVQYGYWPSGNSARVALDSVQAYASGNTVTVNSLVNVLYVDPSSTQSSLTIMLPAVPHNSNIISIYFGGNLTTGTVVTSLTVSANSGQSLIQPAAPATATAGQSIAYRWRAATAQWYRMN